MPVWSAVGSMIVNVGLVGTGMLFGILGIIFGITRGMTKNSEVWALIFAMFAWMFALAMPETTFAFTTFMCGAIAITFAFTPLLQKLESVNIFTVAVVAFVINATLLIGFGAVNIVSWDKSIALTNTAIVNVIQGNAASTAVEAIPDIMGGLCPPNSQSLVCKSSFLKGVFDAVIFDPIASMINIGYYIERTVEFVAMVTLAPTVITTKIKEQVSNVFISFMMGIYLSLWNLIILYNVIKFALAKRGI